MSHVSDERRRHYLMRLRNAGLEHVAAPRWKVAEGELRDVDGAEELTTALSATMPVAPIAAQRGAMFDSPPAASSANRLQEVDAVPRRKLNDAERQSVSEPLLAPPAPAFTTPLALRDGDTLDVLRAEVASCVLCPNLCSTRTQTVFSDGSPTAEICFVGEAPGADEDAQGVPFVGKAGQLLTKIIEACKLRRDEVYICNTLKCRPPGNRNPEPEELANCQPFLDRQLALVKPKMLVALGKFAAARLLGEPPEKVFITKIRGQVREYRGIPCMITLHPAYLLRNPAAKRDVWEDMKKVMRLVGRPID